MQNLTNSTSSTSVEETISTIVDFSYTFVIPVVCFLGICTNIINLVVFSNKELSDITFKCLKVNAVCNMVYLFICFFLFFGRCGRYCTLNTTYFGVFYLYFFYNYFKGIAAINTILIQIIVSYLRLSIVSNRKVWLPPFRITILIMTIFSTIFYLPYLFNRSIQSIESVDADGEIYYKYKLIYNAYGSGDVSKWLIIVTTSLRGFVALFIIMLTNVLSAKKLHEHLAKKKAITSSKSRVADQSVSAQDTEATNNARLDYKRKESQDQANRNLTLMIIWIGVLFFIGNVPNSLGFIFLQYEQIRKSVFIQCWAVFANFVLFSTQGMDIFIYYRFNKKYKAILLKVFKCGR